MSGRKYVGSDNIEFGSDNVRCPTVILSLAILRDRLKTGSVPYPDWAFGDLRRLGGGDPRYKIAYKTQRNGSWKKKFGMKELSPFFYMFQALFLEYHEPG